MKQRLQETVVWSHRHRRAFESLGVEASRGVLLFGPPGTGKTLLARAVATESGATFLAVSITDLIKGHVGESEKAIRSLFLSARRCSPSVVFLDELEALFGQRHLDKFASKVCFVRGSVRRRSVLADLLMLVCTLVGVSVASRDGSVGC